MWSWFEAANTGWSCFKKDLDCSAGISSCEGGEDDSQIMIIGRLVSLKKCLERFERIGESIELEKACNGCGDVIMVRCNIIIDLGLIECVYGGICGIYPIGGFCESVWISFELGAMPALESVGGSGRELGKVPDEGVGHLWVAEKYFLF